MGPGDSAWLWPPKQQSSVCGVIDRVDLLIHRPEVIHNAEQEHSAGEQIQNTGEDLAHVEAVNAEYAEEGQQDPGNVVVRRAFAILDVGAAIHTWDQEQVDDPADKQQTEGEEPDRPCDWAPVIEAMGAEDAEDPQDVANCLAVRVHVQRQCLIGGIVSGSGQSVTNSGGGPDRLVEAICLHACTG